MIFLPYPFLSVIASPSALAEAKQSPFSPSDIFVSFFIMLDCYHGIASSLRSSQ
jgi:hypothetical protein